MNLSVVKAVVTSKDGIQFAVETDAKAVPFETAFAATQTAAQLKAHGDFQPVSSSKELVVAAPEFVFEAPRISGPLEKRAALRVIKGGKAS